MVIVPLFLADPPGGPDASHRIMSPGGYEFWKLIAVDHATHMRFTAGFFQGHPSNARYTKRYRRYRRRPTVNAPPLPSAFSLIEVELARAGSAMLFEAIVANDLQSSDQKLQIVAGRHSLVRNADRSLSLQLSPPSARVELLFQPLVAEVPAAVVFEKGEYVYRADPRCHVSGQIEIGTPGSKKVRTISFLGPGVHEHRWCIHRE